MDINKNAWKALVVIMTIKLSVKIGVKRGYVDKPEHWRYSSGRDYIGLKGLVAVKPLV
jgi:hypothetical protein